ncbi:MAG: hypothetical protein ACEPOW_09825 [Bacteroidales bacterium]
MKNQNKKQKSLALNKVKLVELEVLTAANVKSTGPFESIVIFDCITRNYC